MWKNIFNEGKFVHVCAEETAEDLVTFLGSREAARDAVLIGTVTDDPLSRGYLKTRAGSTHIC